MHASDTDTGFHRDWAVCWAIQCGALTGAGAIAGATTPANLVASSAAFAAVCIVLVASTVWAVALDARANADADTGRAVSAMIAVGVATSVVANTFCARGAFVMLTVMAGAGAGGLLSVPVLRLLRD